MQARITTDNRDMIIHVLQRELDQRAVFGYSPHFTCSIGNYSLLRDGTIVADDPSDAIIAKLTYLGLCDCMPVQLSSDSNTASYYGQHQHQDHLPHYDVSEPDGKVLVNLFSILSARQFQLNQALAARDAFRVTPALMKRLLAHPPEKVSEVLWVLYDHRGEYRGLCIDRLSRDSHCTFTFTGFQKCPPEDAAIHRQLADLIFQNAQDSRWVRPFTRNVRNRKYAFHSWLYQIGMSGPEYEAARSVLLGRLYGEAGHRRLNCYEAKQQQEVRSNG